MSSTNPTPPAETVELAAWKWTNIEDHDGHGSVYYSFIAGSNWKETQLSEEAKALREENARLRLELDNLIKHNTHP